MAYLIDNSA